MLLPWCLDYLDRLEELLGVHSRFENGGQPDDHLDLIDQARGVYRGRLPCPGRR
ncbi:hypothetical protein GCM10010191_93970 [Actinomadura vinacea]|uniref:Uncharacterized protein n=1 Tax=Actinomadura vinacea TaxID=115336 RepID=A0ABN3KGE9_9ACTN